MREMVAATKESAPIIGIGSAGWIVSVDFDAESPYILVNTSTGGGKSVTLRCIAPILSRSPTLGSLRQGQALPGAPRGDHGRSIMEASRASAST
ncbi:hypothetical protein ACWEQM_22490 [Streptomyces nodosus]